MSPIERSEGDFEWDMLPDMETLADRNLETCADAAAPTSCIFAKPVAEGYPTSSSSSSDTTTNKHKRLVGTEAFDQNKNEYGNTVKISQNYYYFRNEGTNPISTRGCAEACTGGQTLESDVDVVVNQAHADGAGQQGKSKSLQDQHVSRTKEVVDAERKSKVANPAMNAKSCLISFDR
eukprot:GSA25T00019649001.1